jgi:hypothetical protein
LNAGGQTWRLRTAGRRCERGEMGRERERAEQAAAGGYEQCGVHIARAFLTPASG